jgi:hypothetical protein
MPNPDPALTLACAEQLTISSIARRFLVEARISSLTTLGLPGPRQAERLEILARALFNQELKPFDQDLEVFSCRGEACSRVRGVANDIQIALNSKRTDPEVARDAVHELESHVGVPGNKIKVTVENGWLTLEGIVDWQSQKTHAESAVRKLKGVIGIANRIELQPRVSAQEVKDRIEEALPERRVRCQPYHCGDRGWYRESLRECALLGREKRSRASRMVGAGNGRCQKLHPHQPLLGT